MGGKLIVANRICAAKLQVRHDVGFREHRHGKLGGASGTVQVNSVDWRLREFVLGLFGQRMRYALRICKYCGAGFNVGFHHLHRC